MPPADLAGGDAEGADVREDRSEARDVACLRPPLDEGDAGLVSLESCAGATHSEPSRPFSPFSLSRPSRAAAAPRSSHPPAFAAPSRTPAAPARSRTRATTKRVTARPQQGCGRSVARRRESVTATSWGATATPIRRTVSAAPMQRLRRPSSASWRWRAARSPGASLAVRGWTWGIAGAPSGSSATRIPSRRRPAHRSKSPASRK